MLSISVHSDAHALACARQSVCWISTFALLARGSVGGVYRALVTPYAPRSCGTWPVNPCPHARPPNFSVAPSGERGRDASPAYAWLSICISATKCTRASGCRAPNTETPKLQSGIMALVHRIDSLERRHTRICVQSVATVVAARDVHSSCRRTRAIGHARTKALRRLWPRRRRRATEWRLRAMPEVV